MPLETERVMCWHVVPCDVTWWWMMALKVDGSIDWLIGVLVLWPDLGCWLSGRGLMDGSVCVWFCERKLVNWQISGETLTHGYLFAHSPSQKKSRSCDLLNIFTGDNTQASTSVLNMKLSTDTYCDNNSITLRGQCIVLIVLWVRVQLHSKWV
jgi:hypothetical protein